MLKSGQNKNDQKLFQLLSFLNSFLQLAAEKKDSKNSASRNFFDLTSAYSAKLIWPLHNAYLLTGQVCRPIHKDEILKLYLEQLCKRGKNGSIVITRYRKYGSNQYMYMHEHFCKAKVEVPFQDDNNYSHAVCLVQPLELWGPSIKYFRGFGTKRQETKSLVTASKF